MFLMSALELWIFKILVFNLHNVGDSRIFFKNSFGHNLNYRKLSDKKRMNQQIMHLIGSFGEFLAVIFVLH